MRHKGLLFGVFVWALTAAVASGQLPAHPSLLRHHPKIAYATAPVTDPVARLHDKVQRGEVTLTFEPVRGYLRSVLDALDVPVESQVLVFSKTSFQAARIGPSNPRAIYFNDTVSVGWVRTGNLLEFISQDPQQGAIFYTLTQTPDETPRFTRNDACVSCHTFDATLNVPGMFVGSVFPGPDGVVQYASSLASDHRTPFWLRWGGWYVTGRHAIDRHMANAVVTDPRNMPGMITPATLNVTSLEGRFDMTGYLSPHSDIVAMLALEHQARLTTLLTRLGWEARIGEADAGRPLDEAAAELVDYLLFIDEAPLPSPVSGTSAFAKTLAAQGPRDRQGRSLRDLNLETRFLEYRCSYLIYSEPFDALPAEALEAVYARLWDVLTGRVAGERYAQIPAAERTAILEILRETKTNLPEYWFDDVAAASASASP